MSKPPADIEKMWRRRLAHFTNVELENELAVYAARVENPMTIPGLRDAARNAVYVITKILEERGAK